ncbi:hypothetical protein ACH5RR_007181 [Cinchona calisaya]|uniref:Uncharacterized protein n=1 Tax=Cinchona calisaya TaxID=153742 RepID=A0ABD3AR72_9GENT
MDARTALLSSDDQGPVAKANQNVAKSSPPRFIDQGSPIGKSKNLKQPLFHFRTPNVPNSCASGPISTGIQEVAYG